MQEASQVNIFPLDFTGTSNISYSKCSIRQIHDIDKWNNSYLYQKRFSDPASYPAFNYQDYIHAWYYILLVRPYTHSWFIQFKKEDPNTVWQMPVWFLDWWRLFGSTSVIFPTLIQTFYQTYKEEHPAEWPPLRCLSFHQDHCIPWILTWDYEIKQESVDYPMELHRIVRVKWWDAFDPKKVHRPTLATNSTTTEQTEYAKLQAKAALEKELTQLKRRAAAFDESHDPFEDNVDLEFFSYDS
ncbi:hypothetical protein Dimus_000422 [Dionaea muscipula]